MPRMALPDVGHVYIVHTTLTKPNPKDKIVVCIRTDDLPLFVWFNTRPQSHGVGQLRCSANDHPALAHECYLDLSRVTTFQPIEIEAAQARGALSADLIRAARDMVADGIETLSPRHAELIVANFSALLD